MGAGEVPHVGQNLSMVRVVRILDRLREPGQVRYGPRRDEVRRVVHRRLGLIDIPDTADVTILLDLIVGDSVVGK